MQIPEDIFSSEFFSNILNLYFHVMLSERRELRPYQIVE